MSPFKHPYTLNNICFDQVMVCLLFLNDLFISFEDVVGVHHTEKGENSCSEHVSS